MADCAVASRNQSRRRFRPRRAAGERGSRRLVRHRRGGDGRPGRRERVRQVGHRAQRHAAAVVPARLASFRLDPLSRRGGVDGERGTDARASRRPHRHHLSGAADVAQSSALDREANRRGAAGAQEDEPGARPRACRRAAASGRAGRGGEPAERPAAYVLRRPATAGDDRDGARQRAGPADRRRAHDRPRRDHSGASPGPLEGFTGAHAHGAAADHA